MPGRSEKTSQVAGRKSQIRRGKVTRGRLTIMRLETCGLSKEIIARN
ncbi:MAG TPA: hypothetical protein VFU86_16465 [Terriglobales bacterium]|nr:hypothetical protein [Terriglobales bacterium]